MKDLELIPSEQIVAKEIAGGLETTVRNLQSADGSYLGQRRVVHLPMSTTAQCRYERICLTLIEKFPRILYLAPDMFRQGKVQHTIDSLCPYDSTEWHAICVMRFRDDTDMVRFRGLTVDLVVAEKLPKDLEKRIYDDVILECMSASEHGPLYLILG